MKGNIFIGKRVMAISIAIVIMLVGFICLNTLPVEQYPNIAPPTVEVTTSYSGADANTCMKSVIQPLEEQINGVQDMTYMTATASSTGDVAIMVYFKQGADADMATVNVQNRVSQAEALLPSDVLQTGVTVTKRQNSILQIAGLKSTDGKYDADFISNYIDINVKPRLMRITGVGAVTNLGNTYALRVWLKPDQMAQYGLEPDDISAAIQAQSFVTSTGTLGQQSENAYQYPMEYKGTLKSIEEFENIVLRTQGNSNVLYLRDVATIEIGAKSYTMTSNMDGMPGVFFLINQAPGANATLVNQQIEALYKQLQPTLPAGLEFVILETSDDFLYAAIDNVVETLVIAILLVILVVYFFLQSFKATIIPSISIIVSLLGTFFIVSMAGFSMNILTLFALVLAIGTVVDDAIVVVEAVMAKLETGKMPGDTPKDKAIEATRQAMSEVSVAVVSCTLVFMAVFIPVTFMSGTSGTFFTQFGITIAGAVGLSCVCALVLCPALCVMLMRPVESGESKEESGKKGKWHWKGINYYTKVAYEASYNAILGKYQGAVQRYLKRPWISVGLLVVAAVLFVFLMGAMPSGLVPQEDQGVIMCEVRMPEGATLHENSEIMKQVEEKVKAIPEMESYGLCSGYGLISSSGSSYASLIIRLKNWDERKGNEHYIDNVIMRFYLDCQSIKNAQVLPFQMPQIPGYGTSNSIDLQVQDMSDGDISDFGNKTNLFLTKLQERPEIASAMSTFSERFPKYKVHVDPIQCERAGTTAKTVLNLLGSYCGGSYVGNFNQYGKVYQILVGAAPEYRLDPSSLNNMYVKVSGDKMAPLSQFITLEEIVGSSSHSHFNLYQSISCSVTAASGYSESQAHDAIAEVFKETMPNYCTYEYGSMSREVEESSKSNTTLLIYAICILLIYLILGSLYNSWLIPFAVLLSVPFGLMGAFLFSWVGYKMGYPGMENNVYLQTGVIMLIGLLAKTAILITEFAAERRKQGLTIVDAALEACKERLRPILMTVITMIVGMLPLVFSSGAGANGNRALAVGVVGGMLIGTIALVFVVPAFFIIFQNWEEKLNGERLMVNGEGEEQPKPKRRTRKTTAVVLLITMIALSSCGVYKKYTPQNEAPDQLFGQTTIGDTLDLTADNMAELSWREFFTDPILQDLIDSALVHNTDMQSAQLTLQKAEASLKAAKLAWLPSLSLQPSASVYGTMSLKGSLSGASYTYDIPLQLDWNIGISGSVIVNKRKANAVLEQAKAQRDAMQANIISSVAQQYFMLLLLDRQLEILMETDSLWNESLETERALWENGKTYSTAVNQMESSNLSVKVQIVDTKRSIKNIENSLCQILAITPQTIRRNTWGEYALPERFGTGVPAVLLQNRPDIRLADHMLEEAFYNTASARAAFYPSFSLQGILGWTNNGGLIADPGALIMKVLGSLVQPIFQQGKLQANLKIAKYSQQDQLNQYVQTVLNAGNEVNECLADCQTAYDKNLLYQRQVEVLQDAYEGTHELMNSGKASYLEVLTAQESLLSAQLNEAENLYNGSIALIGLYIALGGATK